MASRSTKSDCRWAALRSWLRKRGKDAESTMREMASGEMPGGALVIVPVVRAFECEQTLEAMARLSRRDVQRRERKK